MIRHLLILLFVTGWAFSQDGKILLKIYLKDVETGKNVTGALIQLEGFGMPLLDSRYDNKQHFYYFSEIPKGYNTVIAYHKSYNDKGFKFSQDPPSELILRLYHSGNVSYTFEKKSLISLNKDYQKPDRRLRDIFKRLEAGEQISGSHFKNIYSEDPYHIAIISKYDSQRFFTDSTLLGLLRKYDLEYTRSLSGTEDAERYYCYGFDNYGNFFKKNGNTDFNDCDNGLGITTACRVYFFNKKDKTKFSRFTSPEILALRKSGFIVTGITNRTIEYYGGKPFIVNRFYNNGNDFRANDTMQEIDAYYEFGHYPVNEILFDTAKKERKAEFGDRKEKLGYGTDVDDNIYNVYFVVGNNSDASGLGILDQMEMDTSKGSLFNVLPESLIK